MLRTYRCACAWAVASVICAGLLPRTVDAQAYRLRADRVETSSRAHWQAWQLAPGLAEVSAAGEVTPAYMAPSVDAVAAAASYTYAIPSAQRHLYANAFQQDNAIMVRGGIKRAGSAAAAAAHIMDGDPLTFWEPAATDPLSDWWVEIDLGRLVSATRVVVRFAADDPADRADPFLQFRLHSATGQSPFGNADQTGTLDYALIGGTTRPNKDQRTFEFDLTPIGPYAEGFTGRVIQYLRLAVLDTDGDHGELVTAAEFEALAPRDRGAVDHIWRIGGEERVVSVERYAELVPAEQGGVRYYRRERPRLADVEVWTAGVNVGLGILDRGGSLQDPNGNAFPDRAFDGRINTDWAAIVYSTVGDIAEWGMLQVDLGALYRLRAVRTITRVLYSGQAALYGYELRGSDGSLAPDGSLIWQPLSGEERLLNQGTRLFEDAFEPRPIRYLEFHNLDIARRTRAHEGHRYPSVVSEIQIYPTGYVPQVVMTSGFVDLQASRSLTTVTWDATTPRGTAVEVRTRTGDELREVTHYFNAQGQELPNKEAYDRLPSFARGETITEVLAGPGWSNWSQPYIEPGEPVRSPSPRRYMEIEARLLSTDPEAAPSLRAVSVHFVDPVAESVLAEISPKRDVPLAQPTDFQTYVLPEYVVGNARVDRVRLVAPDRAAVELHGVAYGSVAALSAGTARQYTRQPDGELADAGGRALVVAGQGTDTVEVALPALLPTRELLRLSFRAAVYQSGSTFQASVGNSRRPGVWQTAFGGDVVADDLAPGGGMTVLTPLGGRNVRLLGVDSRVFTPNGDGVNEVAVFRLAVLRINTANAVEVVIHDLGGRCLRRLTEVREGAAGLYTLAWDGRDQDGQLVPPGTYIARLAVDSDGEAGDALGTIVSVAY